LGRARGFPFRPRHNISEHAQCPFHSVVIPRDLKSISCDMAPPGFSQRAISAHSPTTLSEYSNTLCEKTRSTVPLLITPGSNGATEQTTSLSRGVPDGFATEVRIPASRSGLELSSIRALVRMSAGNAYEESGGCTSGNSV